MFLAIGTSREIFAEPLVQMYRILREEVHDRVQDCVTAGSDI